MTHLNQSKRQANKTDRAVAAHICEFRALAGMTQTDLAKPLGLTFQQIQKYERATNRVSAGRLVQIAAAVGQPVSAFFDVTDQPVNGINRETLGMVRAFQALPSRGLRDAARSVVKILAETAVEPAPARKAT